MDDQGRSKYFLQWEIIGHLWILGPLLLGSPQRISLKKMTPSILTLPVIIKKQSANIWLCPSLQMFLGPGLSHIIMKECATSQGCQK